ncbi:CocE/NonD family hydrolase [Porticoccaceae bacterium]|nr:CocE/NonD family hydrolase [Porticoccaceae bacterium]
MRDGVRLATEIHLPLSADKIKMPVILTRSPYNNHLADKNNSELTCNPEQFRHFVERGYVVLNQDVRGTTRSEGVLTPIHQEANDGYDAVEWAAVQPWSNGRVGLMGRSYIGATALQGAVSQPPHLIAVSAAFTASDYHDNWTFVNGAFDLWFAQSWIVKYLAKDTYLRQLESSDVSSEDSLSKVSRWSKNANQSITSWTKKFPLKTFYGFDNLSPYYHDWLDHPDYSPYWSAVDLEQQYSNINVPVLLTGGWYDTFSVGTIRNFLGLRKQAATKSAREGTRLLMTPACHIAECGVINLQASLSNIKEELDWWDYWLKGIDNGLHEKPPITLDIMLPPDRGVEGGVIRIAANEFPLIGTEFAKLYLSSGGKANTRHGDGKLHVENSSEKPSDQFVFDPGNPVPTLGGNSCCGEPFPPGVFDQSDIELRDDVLVYTTKPLTTDIVVVGSVKLNFWAKSSARDTDFTAKLVDVHFDGFSQNILDRIVRARYRQGSKMPPSLIEPGRAYLYNLELGPTATVFKQGHSIRLEISSSNFPRFDRNPNTGNTIATDVKMQIATQNILHNKEYPSYLELPVVDKSLIRRYSIGGDG